MSRSASIGVSLVLWASVALAQTLRVEPSPADFPARMQPKDQLSFAKTNAFAYAAWYNERIDYHLKTRLGPDMRRKLVALRKRVFTQQAEWIAERKAWLEKASEQVAVSPVVR